ncbi:MAG: hypothetical protein Q9164_006289 [Protoblastenia rupestris]
MPAPTSREGFSQSKECARCQGAGDTFVVRAERLCKQCLQKYVATKVLKRQELNKIRGGFTEPERAILIPFSFGISSVSLLHLLYSQLSSRKEQHRHAGYTLHLLHIDHSSVLGPAIQQEKFDELGRRFPFIPFTTVLLEACFDYNVDIDTILDQKVDVVVERPLDNLHRLKYILSAASSPTSQADIIDTVRRRLIAAFALKTGCHSILYGDTATRLAERTLSYTAKGRGGLLPWLTMDGKTSDGVSCVYPMRDLLKKELNTFAKLVEPSLSSTIVENEAVARMASSKGNTIDDLMREYFESVEENYPSIVTNVVKTTTKLKSHPIDSNARLCVVCRHHIIDGEWCGDQQETPTKITAVSKEFAVLCYGCARTLHIT